MREKNINPVIWAHFNIAYSTIYYIKPPKYERGIKAIHAALSSPEMPKILKMKFQRSLIAGYEGIKDQAKVIEYAEVYIKNGKNKDSIKYYGGIIVQYYLDKGETQNMAQGNEFIIEASKNYYSKGWQFHNDGKFNEAGEAHGLMCLYMTRMMP